MKIQKFNESTGSNLEQDLLRCGFEKITEDQIPEYTGDEDDDLSSFKSEGVYKFGYLTDDDYCIVELDEANGDDLLRFINGSSDFIIKYNNEFYLGNWSEGKNKIGRDDEWGENSDAFDDFKKEMISKGIKTYYCVNF